MRWGGIRFLDEGLAGSGVWWFWSFELMMDFPLERGAVKLDYAAADLKQVSSLIHQMDIIACSLVSFPRILSYYLIHFKV